MFIFDKFFSFQPNLCILKESRENMDKISELNHYAYSTKNITNAFLKNTYRNDELFFESSVEVQMRLTDRCNVQVIFQSEKNY